MSEVSKVYTTFRKTVTLDENDARKTMLSEIKAELANQSGGNFHVTFPLIPNLRQDFDEFCTFFKF